VPTEVLRRKTSLNLPRWSVDYLAGTALQRDLADAGATLTGRLLDLGCGNSPYRALLPHITAYVPYDRDPAGSRAQVVGVAGTLPFASASFDSVLCTQVLEHVPEPGPVLDEIARVLRPGGRVVLSAPQAWRLHEEPHDYYRYTRYGLAHLFGRAGLRVLECRPQGGAWLLVGQIVNNWLWRPRFRRGSPGWALSRAVSVAGSLLVNSLVPLLDRVFSDPADTYNYVVTAERPG